MDTQAHTRQASLQCMSRKQRSHTQIRLLGELYPDGTSEQLIKNKLRKRHMWCSHDAQLL